MPNHKLSKNVCQDPFGSSVDNDFANRRCNNNNNNNNSNNKLMITAMKHWPVIK